MNSVKNRHYHHNATLSSHELAGFNVLTDSFVKISPAFFVYCYCLFFVYLLSQLGIQLEYFMLK